MSESTNQPTYADRLAALRRAVAIALSDAQSIVSLYSLQDNETAEDRAELAFADLWADLMNALIEHADCSQAELIEMVAGTEYRRIPLVGTVSGPDGRVSWNAGGLL